MNHHKQSGGIFIFLLGLIILASAIGLSAYYIKNKPKAKRSKHVEKIIPQVLVTPLKKVDHKIIIHSVGNVIPAKQINLTAQVSGEIIKVNHNYLPGGRVKKGESLLKIQDLDYKLIKIQKASQVEKALNDLEIEQGKQSVAKTEYKLLGNELSVKDQKLILRKPQLRLAEANLKAAKAQLKQAETNLQRTNIKAPFNSLIQGINVDQGSWVSTGSKLATLIATDQFWIEVSLPINYLAKISIPDFNSKNGAKVIIRYPQGWNNQQREGKIKRLKPNMDSSVRMAQLLIEVKDPLSLNKKNRLLPKLLMGSFVQVAIEGKKLTNVYQIPRSAVHDGKTLWLLSENNTLRFKTIEPLWKNNNYIYIPSNSIPTGSNMIISDLPAPVENMQLSLSKDA